MRTKAPLFLIVLFGALVAVSSANADGGDNAANSCDGNCPDGQVNVSFADGNNATCVCMDPGAGMQDTVLVSADEPQAGDD